MADSKISALISYTNPDPVNDVIPIVDTTNTTTKKISRNNLLGITSTPVGINDSQTLTSKTLTAPTINGATLSGTLSGTYTIGGTPTFPASVVTLTGSQTLTNKILTSPTINAPTITNASITADAITGFSSANTGTIYGIAVTSAVFTTNNIVPNNSLSNTGSFGSAWAWTSWSPSWANLTVGNGTVVARYTQIGKTVKCFIRFTLGSTSSMGTSPTFSLPVTAASQYNTPNNILALGYAERLATTGASITIGINSSTTLATIFTANAAATFLNATAGVTATSPFTWQTGDYFNGTFIYEAA